MEYIVQLFRALANLERIRIIRLLVVVGETNVSQIADAVQLGFTVVSEHLKALASVGLVWRRRSGRIVCYYLAERAGNPVTREALRMLRKLFRSVTADDPHEAARADQSDSATDSDAALFACFTAFTHPRRLQILRYLTEKGTGSLGELARGLSMSERACLRHLAKLERRGFVARRSEGRRTAYIETGGSGAVQRSLAKAVRTHLVAEGE